MQRPPPPPRRMSSLSVLPPSPNPSINNNTNENIQPSQPTKHEPPTPFKAEISPESQSQRTNSLNPSPKQDSLPPIPARKEAPPPPARKDLSPRSTPAEDIHQLSSSQPSQPTKHEPPPVPSRHDSPNHAQKQEHPPVPARRESISSALPVVKKEIQIPVKNPNQIMKRSSMVSLKDSKDQIKPPSVKFDVRKKDKATPSPEPPKKEVNFKIEAPVEEEAKKSLGLSADKAAILKQLQKSFNKETYSKQLLLKHSLDKSGGTPEDEETKKKKKLEYAVLEILTAERAYVKNISFLQKHYIEPLATQQWEGKDEVKYHFDQLNVPSILMVNEQLLQQLEKLFEGNETTIEQITTIGNIFLQLSPYFKSYSFYCSNFESAMKNLEKCYQTIPTFENYCKDRAKESDARGLDLASFLIMPVQRLCRYPLLLGAVKNELPKGNVKDIQQVEKAIETMSEITKLVNEKKREAENRDRVIAIQNSLKNADGVVLVASNRTYLKEGFANLSLNGNDPTNRYLFLFNDILVIAKAKKKILSSFTQSLFTSRNQSDILFSHDISLKELVQLGMCTIRMCNESANILELMIIDQEPMTTYQFIFEDEEKKKWVDSFLCTVIFHRVDGNRILLSGQDDEEEEQPQPSKSDLKKKKEESRQSRSASIDLHSTNNSNKPSTPPVPYRVNTLRRSTMTTSKLSSLQKSVGDLEAFIAVEEEFITKLTTDIASLEAEKSELFKKIEILNQKYDLSEVLSSLGYFDASGDNSV